MLPLFNWSDGVLVSAIKNGTCFLVDEISLADDAVLERLNSVLEPERHLLVAEKGTGHLEQVREQLLQFNYVCGWIVLGLRSDS